MFVIQNGVVYNEEHDAVMCPLCGRHMIMVLDYIYCEICNE